MPDGGAGSEKAVEGPISGTGERGMKCTKWFNISGHSLHGIHCACVSWMEVSKYVRSPKNRGVRCLARAFHRRWIWVMEMERVRRLQCRRTPFRRTDEKAERRKVFSRAAWDDEERKFRAFSPATRQDSALHILASGTLISCFTRNCLFLIGAGVPRSLLSPVPGRG